MIFGNLTPQIPPTQQTPAAQYCKLPDSYVPIKLKILNKRLSPGYQDSGLCEAIPTNRYLSLKSKLKVLKRNLKNVQLLYNHRMLYINQLAAGNLSRVGDIMAIFRSDFMQDMTTLEIRYYETLLDETSPINSPTTRDSISELDQIAVEFAQAEDQAPRQNQSLNTGIYRLRRGVIYAHNTSGHPPSIDNLSETD